MFQYILLMAAGNTTKNGTQSYLGCSANVTKQLNAANLPAKLYTINHPHNTTHHFFSNKNQISKKVSKMWGQSKDFQSTHKHI